MKTEKEIKKEIDRMKYLIKYILLFSIPFFIGYIEGAVIANSHDIFTKSCINIPDQNKINAYCKEHNYDNGWLSSSSCKGNQVMCNKNIFSFSDRIYCLIIPDHSAVLSTDKHLCQNCYTRVVCSDKKKVD